MRPIDSQAPDPKALEEAAQALREGHLVLLPTETVYGIAADPGQPEAMRKLYAVKGRDAGKPVAYFIDRLDQVEALGARWTAEAHRLAKQFWPGPLTLVLSACAGEGTLGFRMPDYAPALRLTGLFGPMAVTSANPSGAKEALTAAEAQAFFGRQIEVYLDAGPSRGGVPSTVVLCPADGPVRILREGAISAAEIFHRPPQ